MRRTWTTVRVFISSTFRDMHPERDHLVTMVFPELQERMAARRLHLRAIDLRWGVLEEENAVDVCLGVIEECRPFFVGLLGNRHGSLPPPPREIPAARVDAILHRLAPSQAARIDAAYESTTQDEIRRLRDGIADADLARVREWLEVGGLPDAGLSVTALEMFRGVLDHPGEMVSLFYFRNPRVTNRIPAPHWDVYNESDRHAAAKLRALKRRIKKAGLARRVYSCRWDGDATTLVDLDAFGARVLEDLWQAIAARYPPDHDTATDALGAEREAMSQYREVRIQHFVGRRALLDDIERLVERRAAGADAPGLISIVGPPGSGKSTLLGRLDRELQTKTAVRLFSHYVGASPESTRSVAMTMRCWRDIAQATGRPDEPPRDPRELLKTFGAFLEASARTHPLCILVDAVDRLDALDLPWLPDRIPPRITFIVSLADEHLRARLTRRADAPHERVLGPLDESDVHALIRRYLGDHFRKLAPSQVSRLLAKSSTRNALYLLVALDELLTTGRFDRLEEQIQALPDDLPALLEVVLARVEKEHGRSLVRDLLCFLAVGRGGQAEEDLRTLVRPTGAHRLPDLSWTRLLRSLKLHLLRRPDFIDFAHDQFRQAVERRYLDEETRRQFHSRAASYLASRGLDYPRTLSELPFHYRAADRYPELCALIEAEEFRGRKLTATESMYEVSADIGLAFDAALDRDDLARVSRYGFLMADYAERRFASWDPLQTYRRDRLAALAETRWLAERPRARFLLLFARLELAIAQPASARELVLEAAGTGLRWPEEDRGFLADTVARLLNAGIDEAIDLVGRGCPAPVAATLAARIAPGIAADHQARCLDAAIGWLRQDFVERPEATKPMDAFEAVARAAAAVSDPAEGARLVEALEKLIDEVRFFADVARTTADRAIGVAYEVVRFMDARREGRPRGPTTLADAKIAMQATLGTALLEEGWDAYPRDLLAKAIEACGREGTLPWSYGAVAHGLWRLDAARAIPLFRQLLARVSARTPFEAVHEILLAIPDSSASRDGGPSSPLDPALGAIVEALDDRASGVTAVNRARLLQPLAIAYAATGRTDRTERLGHELPLSPSQLPMVGWNPFLLVEHRVSLMRETIELGALTRQGPDAGWTTRWLRRLARWTARLENDQARARELRRLIDVASRVQAAVALEAAIEAGISIQDVNLRATVVRAGLEAATTLDVGARTTLRNRCLERAESAEQPSKAVIWTEWIATASRDERPRILALRDRAAALADSRARATMLGQAASALSRLERPDEADEAWHRAALADQEELSHAPRFALRAVASAGVDDRRAWGEVLAAAACENPAVAARLVISACASCTDPEKLLALDLTVGRLPWRPYPFERPLFLMHLAIARAWGRLGRCRRGARLAARAIERRGLLTIDEEEFDMILNALGRLTPSPVARVTWLRIIPEVARSAEEHPERVAALAEALCSTGSFSPRALRCLSRALSGSRHHGWVAVLGGSALAAGLVRAGFRDAARRLVDRIQVPARASLDDDLLGRLALPSFALAWFGHALTDLYGEQGEPARVEAAFERTLEAASEVQGGLSTDRSSTAVAMVWHDARRLGLPIADVARDRAVDRAHRAMRDSPYGSRWEVVADAARAYMATGEFDEALGSARGIADDEKREHLLIDLAAADTTPPEIARRIWNDLGSGDARRDAAWAVARRALRLRPGEVKPIHVRDILWPESTVTEPSTLLRRIVATAISSVVYALAWLAFQLIVGPGLAGPHARLWLAALMALLLGILGTGAYGLRHEISNVLGRSGAAAIVTLILPFFFGAWVFDRARDSFETTARNLVLLSERFRRAPRDGAREWRLAGPPPPVNTLLRASLGESEAFDLLLASVVAPASRRQHLAGLVACAPPLAVPSGPPSELTRQQHVYEHMVASGHRLARLARRLRHVLSGVSLFVFGGFVYLPLSYLAAARRDRRGRRAQQLYERGNDLLRSNRPADAGPLLGQAAALMPLNPHGWHDYACALARSRRTDEAVAAHRRAIERGIGWPAEKQFRYALGYTLFNAGRYEDAIAAFDEVLAMAPPESDEYEEAQRGRGYCLTNLGRHV